MNSKNLIIVVGLVFIGLLSHAQSKIKFDYDETGNRKERRVIDPDKSALISGTSSAWDDALKDQLKNHNIRIYPNPTKGKIKIEIPTIDDHINGVIEVFDNNGRLILNKNSIKSSNILNLTHVKNGFYFLNIRYQDEILRWKIIKQ